MSAHVILVAEDDAEVLHEIGAFLQKHGYGVIPVGDGYQALDFAIRDKPDLLLLDVHLPAGNGFSVHERVARHPDLALVPVIYMTRDHSAQIETDASTHGAFALLYKPFEMESLLEQIQTALMGTNADAA